MLPQLAPFLPKHIETYAEPFLGGGAMALYLASTRNELHTLSLSDINSELINTWSQIGICTLEVVRLLSHLPVTKETFNKVKRWQPTDSTERAAKFIYLNKTAFNGLYRVNRSNEFNVPYAGKDTTRLFNIDNLCALNQLFRQKFIEVDCRPFSAEHTQPFRHLIFTHYDFIYCDPPYAPLSKTANFTSYTKDGFTLEDHEALAEQAKRWSQRGSKVMISNSDTPEVREIFKDFHIDTIYAPRSINCKGDKRGRVTELVIRSYR